MISIDEVKKEICITVGEKKTYHPFESPEAFAIISDIWLKVGWDVKHVYTFTWMGRPVIQLPEDMLRLQEVIYDLKPDVILETGIAHGGSLIFYASLCKAMGKGRVIGVDIEIRPHNRKSMESHELYTPYIQMIEGSSIAPKTEQEVRNKIAPHEKVLVLLDSNHTREHVLSELKMYSRLVSVGSYIVACDGIMKQVVGLSRTQPDWVENNPQSAVLDFLKENENFILETPPFKFNESLIQSPVTYWPGAWLKRVK